MSIYEAPDRNRSYYSCKFVRIGETICVTDPDDIETKHINLLAKDNMMRKFIEAKKDSPDELDGGIVSFANDNPQEAGIIINNISTTLDIPPDEQARTKTVELFSKKTPGYAVVNIQKFGPQLS